MKKYFVIAFAALVAISSCTKNEIAGVADEALTFSVVNYVQQTRADVYPTSSTFGVYAYFTPENWATDGDANVFMDNLQIRYSPEYAQGQWGSDAKYFWPKSGAITFACYSPYTETSGNGFAAAPTFSKAGGFAFNYTIVDDTNVDLMTADLVTDQSRSASTTVTPTQQVGVEPVPVLFHHLLTQVAFKFQTVKNPNPNVEKNEVVVKAVTINGINNTASFGSSAWAGQSGAVSYLFNPATGNDLTLLPDESPLGTQVASRILLPQTLGTAQQVEVTYVIRTKYASNPDWTEETMTNSIEIASALIPAWTPNMNVVYTITINPYSTDPILFDPAIVPWAPVVSETLTI